MKRKRTGFTFIELVIAFVVMSMSAVMVSGSVTSIYMMTKKLSGLTSVCYSSQEEMEEELQILDKLLTARFRTENDINTNGETPELAARISDIDSELSVYEKQTAHIFGKDVDVYHFSRTYTDENGLSLTLDTGAAGEVVLERPVPVIDEVKAAPAGTADEKLYFGNGRKIYTKVDYKSDNYSYRYGELYQWYISVNNDHTPYYTNGVTGEELLQELVFSVYPSEFTILSSEKKDFITVKPEYAGHFLVCLVTPLSTGGRMGNECVSNLVYISALPELDYGAYALTVDASMIPVESCPEKKKELDEIITTGPGYAKLNSAVNEPVLDFIGEPTDTDLSSSYKELGTNSRYLTYEDGIISLASCSASGLELFAAVKYDDISETFVTTDLGGYKFSDCVRTDPAASDTGWSVVRISFTEDHTDLRIGDGSFKLAELVGVYGAEGTDQDNILDYLCTKYNIY